MLVKFPEQVVEKFKIPSFTLGKGDIVIIRLPGGPYFRPAELEIIDLLLKAKYNQPVGSAAPLKYVEHLMEWSFWHHIFPLSVGAYHNKYANKANPIYMTIYDIKWMNPKIKVQTLAGTVKRKLALYTTLSLTNNIIFDLAGVDPQGGREIYDFVKTVVKSGGSAILFDLCDEFKDECTSFIKAEYIGPAIPVQAQPNR